MEAQLLVAACSQLMFVLSSAAFLLIYVNDQLATRRPALVHATALRR